MGGSPKIKFAAGKFTRLSRSHPEPDPIPGCKHESGGFQQHRYKLALRHAPRREIPRAGYTWEFPFDDLKFRKINSDLLKIVQEFIGYELMKEKNHLKLRIEFEGIINEKIEPLYKSIRNQLVREEKYRLDHSAEFYYDRFETEKLLFEIKTEFEKKNRKSDIQRDLNIVNINDNLDKFYLIEKLKLYATLLSWKKIAKLEIDIGNIQKAIDLLPKSEKNKSPVIRIYELIINMLQDPVNQDPYFELKKTIRNYKDHLPRNEIKYVYDAAITYAVDRTNEGVPEFLTELFELYQKQGGKSSYKTFQRKIDKLSENKFIKTTKSTGKGGNTTIVEKKLTEF